MARKYDIVCEVLNYSRRRGLVAADRALNGDSWHAVAEAWPRCRSGGQAPHHQLRATRVDYLPAWKPAYELQS